MGQMQCLAVDNERVECSDCDWRGIAADLDLISDYEERVSAGEICPAGQCPECGALAHLVTEETPPAAALERAAPAMFAALGHAVARIEMANAEGNPILSAWLPDARAALDLCSREETAPETFAPPARVDHNDIATLAEMIGWRTARAAYFRQQGGQHNEQAASKLDDDACTLCTRMKRLCAGDKSALDLDPREWPDAPSAKAEESTGAEIKAAAARDVA